MLPECPKSHYRLLLSPCQSEVSHSSPQSYQQNRADKPATPCPTRRHFPDPPATASAGAGASASAGAPLLRLRRLLHLGAPAHSRFPSFPRRRRQPISCPYFAPTSSFPSLHSSASSHLRPYNTTSPGHCRTSATRTTLLLHRRGTLVLGPPTSISCAHARSHHFSEFQVQP